jgi:hypothetical protein
LQEPARRVDLAVAVGDHQQTMGQARRGRHQAQLFKVDKGQAQFLAHEQRQSPPVSGCSSSEFNSAVCGMCNSVHGPTVRIVGARLAVEQADFAEPVRRLHQTQQRLLALLAHRADAHGPSSTAYKPQGGSPRLNKRWPGDRRRTLAAASRLS